MYIHFVRTKQKTLAKACMIPAFSASFVNVSKITLCPYKIRTSFLSDLQGRVGFTLRYRPLILLCEAPANAYKKMETTGKVNRDRRMDVRVSDDEYRQIAERAKRAGLGVSEYVRRAALDQAVVEVLTSNERAALVGIGRNLNQALIVSHGSGELSPAIREILIKLKKILQA